MHLTTATVAATTQDIARVRPLIDSGSLRHTETHLTDDGIIRIFREGEPTDMYQVIDLRLFGPGQPHPTLTRQITPRTPTSPNYGKAVADD